MKILLLLLFLALSIPGTFAQIINGGFENWNGTEPEGWKTNNLSSTAAVVKSAECNSGSYSISCSVVDFIGINYPPILTAGENAEGFSVTEKYKYLTGYYKFLPKDASDRMTIAVSIYNNTGSSPVLLGYGVMYPEQSQNFSHFNVELNYTNDTLTPDIVKIVFSLSSTTSSHLPNVGAAFYLDDLSLTKNVDVKGYPVPEFNFALHQNYPNPFNPSTTIKYEIPKTSFVRVLVYNLLGENIATLVNSIQKEGNYSTDWNAFNLSSGIYFYSIYSKPLDGSKKFSDVKKMILLK